MTETAPTGTPPVYAVIPPQKSNWGTAILAGVVALATAVLAAVLGYWFGSSLETQKQQMQIQLSAYVDFAKAQAAWQRAGIDPETMDAQLKELRAAMINPASTDAQLKKLIGDAMTNQASTDASLKLRDASSGLYFSARLRWSERWRHSPS